MLENHSSRLWLALCFELLFLFVILCNRKSGVSTCPEKVNFIYFICIDTVIYILYFFLLPDFGNPHWACFCPLVWSGFFCFGSKWQSKKKENWLVRWSLKLNSHTFLLFCICFLSDENIKFGLFSCFEKK